MNIGELAQMSGLSASRIRFYEAQGLIRQVQRQANGYRRYSPQVLQTLQIIQCAQQSGFTLDELKRLLPGAQTGAVNQDELIGSLLSKIQQIEVMQLHLAQNKAHLLELIDNIQTRPEGMGCEANAERVLASLKHQGL